MYIKPVFEYYFFNKRISPFIRLGYDFQMFNSEGENTFYQSPIAGLGVSILNKSENFGVSLGADYYFNKQYNRGGVMPFVSLNFYFNKKRKLKNILY